MTKTLEAKKYTIDNQKLGSCKVGISVCPVDESKYSGPLITGSFDVPLFYIGIQNNVDDIFEQAPVYPELPDSRIVIRSRQPIKRHQLIAGLQGQLKAIPNFFASL